MPDPLDTRGMSSADIGRALLSVREAEHRNPLTTRWPYYSLCPKDLNGNLDFRERIGHACNKKPYLRHQFWSMCKRDLLFYINSACFIFEPRPVPKELPFITYQFQDTALTKIDASLGRKDMVIEKSRDMGASWMVITVMEWRWQFYRRYAFLLLSRVEDLVDRTDDPDTLFWKFDFLRTKQWRWLQAPVTRTDKHCLNRMLDGVIDGSSTNKFAGTGGRRTAILADEFSKMDNQSAIFTGTMAVSDCRYFVFTPQGTGNKAYDIAHDPKIEKLTLHWTKHPLKSVGLYYTNEKVTSGIRFQEGKPRSIWYDKQCERASHPKEIAQELDIDYLGSSFQFFDGDLLHQLRQTTVKPPTHRGDVTLDNDGNPTGFTEIGNGRLKLWCFLDDNDEPPHDRNYAIGADISTGELMAGTESSSNSVLSIVDLKTGEQVGEFVTGGVPAVDFAMITIAICRWFRGPNGPAFLMWERNGGPGITYTQQIMKTTFRNFYYETVEDRMSRKRSDKPGHHTTIESKKAMLAFIQDAWKKNRVIPRSAELLIEASQYIYTPRGDVKHSRQAESENPTEAGDNHGDRVIAAALACKIVESRPEIRVAPVVVENTATFAHRRKVHEKALREKELIEW